MLFQPTTSVNVLRGTVVDSLGDVTDGGFPVAEGVPAHIAERSKMVKTPGTDAPRVVRLYSARLPGTVDLQIGDRLEDAETGIVYMVDSDSRGAGAFAAGDLRIDLRRVT